MSLFNATSISWLRGCARLAVLAGALAASSAVSAQPQLPIKGEVALTQQSGFTRLAFHFDEEVGIKIADSNGILIVSFSKPVNIAVDQLAAKAPDLIRAARRDPDGGAVRIGLARKMKLHSIPAAERYFLDLLPETWTGVLPGPPQDVVDELARRAREAERLLRERNGEDARKQILSARVKAGVQPTFTRFVFELPPAVDVSSERSDDALALRFDRRIQWDVADARAVLPAGVTALDTEIGSDSTRVTFSLKPPAQLRSFREERAFVVDVDTVTPPKLAAAPAAPAVVVPAAPVEKPPPAAAPSIAAPQTMPADKTAEQPAPEPPVQKAAVQEPPPAEPAPVAKPAAPKEPDSTPTPQAAAPPPAALPPADPKAPVKVRVQRLNDGIVLNFTFAAVTPAAVFRRGDVVWLVFDSKAPLDLAALNADAPGIRKSALVSGGEGVRVLRLTLDRPRLVGVSADASTWSITIADTLSRPSLPLAIARSVVGRNRANIVVPIAHASAAHRLRDPETGEQFIAVSAPPPGRGLLKEHSFLELRALASAQGVAVQPLADDVKATLKDDGVTFSRPGGFSISAVGAPHQLSGIAATFDPQTWGLDRNAPFLARESELIRAAAEAPQSKRWEARLNLARFYLARDMAVEAKAVLDVALSEPHSKEDVTGSIARAISNIDLQRPADAMKDLSTPQIGKQQNATVWRAVALARQGKWTAASDGFKDIETATATMPIELQRVVLMEGLRTAIETRDAAAANRFSQELDGIGIPAAERADADVLAGRYDEELGRKQDALMKYRSAISSTNARAAAEGRLREIELRLSMNDLSRKDAINGLETLTAVWRGDDTETEGLRLLAHLYREEGRYREAFHAMRVAVLVHPDSDITRKIQDDSAAAFQELFLQGKADSLPPVEALGLFYDYRELTPIGRRGDEMIRKLADRLIAVDLLDQASELLQHQVDKRLQGAARAQVAAKLATIYLMNHQAQRALATLKATRDSDVSNELREQRLLLEARALSELGRHPLALEIVSGLDTPEALRLRADVLWAAKRWREAGEAIEKLYGERWRDFKPLTESERADILRAAIGYAMADEALSLQRLREKYAAKMADGPDARAFEVVSSPIGTSGTEFKDVARRVGTVDTLSAFLRAIRARYEGDKKQVAADGKPQQSGEVPGQQATPAPPKPPAGGVPLKPDLLPTGAVRKQ